MQTRPFAAILLGGFFLLVSSCSQSLSPRGDAMTRGEGQFRTTKLPLFPIGHRGVHTFKVSDLQVSQFPYLVRVHTTKSLRGEWGRRRPFDEAILKVEILGDGGRLLAQKLVKLNNSRSEGVGKFDQFFYRKGELNLGFQPSYRVKVTVIEPSRREWDKAQLLLR